MKAKNDIIEELKATAFVENYARQFCGIADRVYFDDIVAELYLIICELPAKLVEQIYNGCGIDCFRRYVSGIVVKQMRSDNSRVYRKYTRHVYRETPVEVVAHEGRQV